MRKAKILGGLSAFLLLLLLGAGIVDPTLLALGGDGPRVIQITADRDNRFKVPGQKQPIITVKAGEVIKLRITAHKGTEWDKDGAIHSFTVTALKDRGWDIRLKEGTKDYTLVAPDEPGEYAIECLVKCGNGHDDMKMKLVVTK